jgi:transcriptional regulator with XRE-family HTH domain
MYRIPAVGRLLEEARRQAKRTQIEIAAALGFTQSTASLVERGYIGNVRTVIEIARFLRADLPLVLTELEAALPLIRAANKLRLAEDIEHILNEHRTAAA